MTRRYLFLCVANSCRSQMAEGFARMLIERHGLDVEVASGGTRPGGRIDPGAIEAMAARGIDITGQSSGPMDPAFAEAADQIVTMGCSAEDACPAHILPKVEDWGFDDPVGQDPATYHRVRDGIEAKVRTLLGVPPEA